MEVNLRHKMNSLIFHPIRSVAWPVCRINPRRIWSVRKRSVSVSVLHLFPQKKLRFVYSIH